MRKKIVTAEQAREYLAAKGAIAVLDENARLTEAILWALGEGETPFPDRPAGETGNYYWRSELRQRAGL